MRKLILILFGIFVFPSIAIGADTILLGWDSTTSYNDADCNWLDTSTTISEGAWKSSRFQAQSTGTVSYLKLRDPNTPTGCTNDSGCVAIYEGGTSSSLGALKGYGCFSGYDWTTIGVGDHTFNFTTTVTDLTVTSGQYYWIVFYSWAAAQTAYTNAGCSQQILAYRGRDLQDCYDKGYIDVSSTPSISASQTSVVAPPAYDDYDIPTQTYMMWGIWAEGDTSVSQLSGCTISGGSIQ